MEDKLLRIEEVAAYIGVSTKTINHWYWAKALDPENEILQILPEIIRGPGNKKTRFWKMSDLWKFYEFQTRRPIGRNGIMGKVTQRYIKKEKKNGQEKIN